MRTIIHHRLREKVPPILVYGWGGGHKRSSMHSHSRGVSYTNSMLMGTFLAVLNQPVNAMDTVQICKPIKQWGMLSEID